MLICGKYLGQYENQIWYEGVPVCSDGWFSHSLVTPRPVSQLTKARVGSPSFPASFSSEGEESFLNFTSSVAGRDTSRHGRPLRQKSVRRGGSEPLLGQSSFLPLPMFPDFSLPKFCDLCRLFMQHSRLSLSTGRDSRILAILGEFLTFCYFES